MTKNNSSVQVCTKCAVDSTVPGVIFDEQGVCIYCKLHNILDAEYPQGDEGQQKLNQYVEQIKASGKNKRYDCVIGVSGGTDSIYLLYWAKQNGLRPLVVHFDNGWDSEIAVNNIQKALEKLDLDLQTYIVDWEEFKDVLVSFLKASFPWADAPTDLAINATLYRIAADEGLHYILNGSSFRTEGKMPAEWTYVDGRIVRYIQRKFGTKNIKSFPNLTMFDFIFYSVIKKIRILRPLNFLDYHKSKAREVLERELGWKYYGGHHYESIYTRFVYSFLLPQKFNINKKIITNSALVRSGELTRQQALDDLKQDPYPEDKVGEDVEYVIKKLGLTPNEFEEIMSLPPKNFRDYPSYYPLFEKLGPLVKMALKFALPWTPPMMHEMEIRQGKRK